MMIYLVGLQRRSVFLISIDDVLDWTLTDCLLRVTLTVTGRSGINRVQRQRQQHALRPKRLQHRVGIQ